MMHHLAVVLSAATFISALAWFLRTWLKDHDPDAFALTTMIWIWLYITK